MPCYVCCCCSCAKRPPHLLRLWRAPAPVHKSAAGGSNDCVWRLCCFFVLCIPSCPRSCAVCDRRFVGGSRGGVLSVGVMSFAVRRGGGEAPCCGVTGCEQGVNGSGVLRSSHIKRLKARWACEVPHTPFVAFQSGKRVSLVALASEHQSTSDAQKKSVFERERSSRTKSR